MNHQPQRTQLVFHARVVALAQFSFLTVENGAGRQQHVLGIADVMGEGFRCHQGRPFGTHQNRLVLAAYARKPQQVVARRPDHRSKLK